LHDTPLTQEVIEVDSQLLRSQQDEVAQRVRRAIDATRHWFTRACPLFVQRPDPLTAARHLDTRLWQQVAIGLTQLHGIIIRARHHERGDHCEEHQHDSHRDRDDLHHTTNVHQPESAC